VGLPYQASAVSGRACVTSQGKDGGQRRRATPIDHCCQRQRLRTDAHAVLVGKILTFRFFQKGLIFGVKIDFHGLFALLRFGH